MALVSTAAVSMGNSSSGDEGSFQGVLVAIGFEPIAHSDAW